MAAKARLALDPLADLRRRLARRPRRAPTTLRATIRPWWKQHDLAALPPAVGKRIAIALLEDNNPDAKLCGIVVLSERLADHLHVRDLPAFAPLFVTGTLVDSELEDWFAVKVLGTMLLRVRGRADVARALASWCTAETTAQRRAACVAFTVLAPQGDGALTGLARLIFTMCSTVLWSIEPGDQTAVGWLLHELSRGEPTRVEAFVRRHARFMSRECVCHAVEKLAAARQTDLLTHWRRATSLARS